MAIFIGQVQVAQRDSNPLLMLWAANAEDTGQAKTLLEAGLPSSHRLTDVKKADLREESVIDLRPGEIGELSQSAKRRA